MIEDIENKWENLYAIEETGDKQIRLSGSGFAELFLNINENKQKTILLYVPEIIWNEYSGFHHKNFDNLSIEFILKNNKGWISLSLKNNKLGDLFNDLIFSLFRRIGISNDSKEHCKIFISTYWKWSRFFDMENQFKLPFNEILGLFGELKVLADLLNTGLGISTVIDSWRGPFGDEKDFFIIDKAFEIKSIMTTNDEIKISSIYQLEPVLGKKLFLVVLELEHSSLGISIFDLVNSISDTITNRGGSLNKFWECLNAINITKANIEEYKSPLFKEKKRWSFHVDMENFPRLTRSDNNIPEKIKNVQYTLNLSTLKPFETASNFLQS